MARDCPRCCVDRRRGCKLHKLSFTLTCTSPSPLSCRIILMATWILHSFWFFFLLSFTSKPKSVYFFSLNSSLFQLELLSSRSAPVFSNWSCCLLLHLQPLPTEAVVCFAAGRIISAIMMEKFMAHEILAGRSCPHFKAPSICNSVV